MVVIGRCLNSIGGVSNTLTGVQKDNMVVELYEVGCTIRQEGKDGKGT